jgi:hypothetical protein
MDLSAGRVDHVEPIAFPLPEATTDEEMVGHLPDAN